MKINPFSMLRIFTQITTSAYDISDVAAGGVSRDELQNVLKDTIRSLEDDKLRLDEAATVICVMLLYIKEEAHREQNPYKIQKAT